MAGIMYTYLTSAVLEAKLLTLLNPDVLATADTGYLLHRVIRSYLVPGD